MKQCIKYLMIVLFGVLLYTDATQAAAISYTPGNDSERCILSQAPTSSQQDIRNLYSHLSSIPLYSVDSTQVPGNKSFLILLNYVRMYRMADSQTFRPLLPPTCHPVPDPLSYYIFGLRKIIV